VRNCVPNRRSRVRLFPDLLCAEPHSKRRLTEGPEPRHYSYRVDHDLGFAPHIEGKLCSICGCKMTTIEQWTEPGSWIVGIGGKHTGKPDALIYAMKIEQTPSHYEFRKAHPTGASYLSGRGIPGDAPVLVSTHFYYFGDRAKPLPPELTYIIHTTQGCKRLSDSDIVLLNRLVLSRYRCGALGKPNNSGLKS
jgi:hypothetical protein